MSLNGINYGIEILLLGVLMLIGSAFFAGQLRGEHHGRIEGQRGADRWYAERPVVAYKSYSTLWHQDGASVQTIALVDPCFSVGPEWTFVRWENADKMVIVCRDWTKTKP